MTEWNERQAQRAPLLFSPTIGAAVACCTQSVDMRRLDWHPDAMVTSLISKL